MKAHPSHTENAGSQKKNCGNYTATRFGNKQTDAAMQTAPAGGKGKGGGCDVTSLMMLEM
jgi:hypothetical protein